MAGTSAAAGRPGAPPSPSRRPPAPAQAAETDLGHAPLVGEVRAQCLRPGGRQLVGTPSVVARQRLDESLALEPAERLIRRPRRQADVSELLDVLGEGVAMLRSVREAGQDERGRTGIAAERDECAGLSRCVTASWHVTILY